MLNSFNFEKLQLFKREVISDMPDFQKKYFKTHNSIGLCNQLFSLTNGILISNKNFFIIDSFYLGNDTNKIAPISKILDLKKTSLELTKILDRPIYLLDRSEKIELNIEYALYGNKDIKYEVTNKFIEEFNKTKSIWKKINNIFSDKFIHQQKEFIINYKIGDYHITEKILEKNYNLEKEISFDENLIVNWKNVKHCFGWYDNNLDLFNKILKSIKFNDFFYSHINNQNIDFENVIHLRIESDSINHWSKQNSISNKEFYNILSNKYIDLIKSNIPENKTLTILSGIEDNHEFILKLKKNYNIFRLNKIKILESFQYRGREINAILDLIVGFKTKKKFIGCHNFEQQRGSTFSYTIINHLENVECNLIDLDNIV